MPATFHRDDRLVAGNAASDSRKLPWVAETFEVEQDHLGSRIGIPILQEIVTRDVSPVTGRDERRQADSTSGGLVEDGDSERTGLAEESDVARAREHGRQRGVEGHRGVVVGHSECVGPDESHPVRPRRVHETPLGLLSVESGFAESGRDHDERFDAFVEAVVQNCADRLGGDGDHAEIHLVGNVADGRVGPHTLDGTMLGIDRVHGAGEPGPQQVGEHGVPDLGTVGGGTDHCNRPRTEHVSHTARLGRPLPGITHRDHGFGGVDRELRV